MHHTRECNLVCQRNGCDRILGQPSQHQRVGGADQGDEQILQPDGDCEGK